MIDPIKWPLQTNPDIRDGILADKINKDILPVIDSLEKQLEILAIEVAQLHQRKAVDTVRRIKHRTTKTRGI